MPTRQANGGKTRARDQLRRSDNLTGEPSSRWDIRRMAGSPKNSSAPEAVLQPRLALSWSIPLSSSPSPLELIAGLGCTREATT